MKTRVGIVGAGPTGLLLDPLLKAEGTRAGVLEQASIDARLDPGGLPPDGGLPL